MNEKKNGKPRRDMVAVLDLGTSKAACFVAKVEEDGWPTVIGVGHQPSKGVRAGAVVDIEDARTAVTNAVHAAERMAGGTIKKVFVGIGCGRPTTEQISVSIETGGREIGAAEMRKILDLGKSRQPPSDRELLHSLPMGFRVDGQRGIRDPRGLYGKTLGLDLNIVTAEAGPVRSLSTCIAGGHLDVEAFVVTPYASALACLVDDEMALGTIVIDMGGGTTDIAAFQDGALVFADSVPIGGTHATQDIAHGLSTPLAHAERIKIQYGGAVPQPGDDRAVVDVPQIGAPEDGPPNHMPKSLLVGIIKPRIEETFELVRAKLEASGLPKAAARRVVLTGGASQLAGADQLAGSVLDRQVRLARPRRLRGLAESATGPSFAVSAGLILYALERHDSGGLAPLAALVPPKSSRRRAEKERRPSTNEESARPGVIRRLGTWLHDHF
ncbi:MAG: cell division protein FtsA [Rhodospirillaceae bacterium]|nr:cell division protein FtsA [Rhodospirillaceae bacterium]